MHKELFPSVITRLCQAYQISQTLTQYCQQKSYAPWNGFYGKPDSDVIAAWLDGLQQCLAEFLDVVVIVQHGCVEGRHYSSIYLCLDELHSKEQRWPCPSRHWVTLALMPPYKQEGATTEPPLEMSLRTILGSANQVLISALLNRFNSKVIAPYTREALAAAVALSGHSCVWKLCWAYANQSNRMTLLAFESALELGVERGILLPETWRADFCDLASRSGFEAFGGLRLDASNAFIVMDEQRHQRFARPELFEHLLSGPAKPAPLLVATYTHSQQAYVYLKDYAHNNAYEAVSYANAQHMQWDITQDMFCDLINADGESLIPPSTQVLADTINSDGCVICTTDTTKPARQDWFSLRHPQRFFNCPLRWLKVVGERENRRAVQSPDNYCWGYIDAEGELSIAAKFADWGLFHRGLAEVSLPAAPHLYGLINKTGEFVLAPQWLDLYWSSAKWVAAKNTQREWGALALSDNTGQMAITKTLLPFQSAQKWLDLYEKRVGSDSYRRGVSWGDKSEEEKIVAEMEAALIENKQAQVDSAKASASLAALMGLFDGATGETELASLGLWGRRVEVIAFAGSDQAHEKLVGQQGVIMSHYPVGLNTFDLAVEAPIDGLATYPNAVMGVSWAGLKWINT